MLPVSLPWCSRFSPELALSGSGRVGRVVCQKLCTKRLLSGNLFNLIRYMPVLAFRPSIKTDLYGRHNLMVHFLIKLEMESNLQHYASIVPKIFPLKAAVSDLTERRNHISTVVMASIRRSCINSPKDENISCLEIASNRKFK